MMNTLITWIESSVSAVVGGIATGSYPTIVILMAIESSFIPLPSEIVMIPAGYAAFQGNLNFAGVVLAGTVGSIIGALFNYYLAMKLGRPFLLRYGHRMLIPTHKLHRVEEFFMTRGHIATFVGRLLPGVRHLISIPAGLGRMPLGRFVLYTGTGAGLWCLILTWFGYWLAQKELVWREGWQLYKSQITVASLSLVVLVLVAYLALQRVRGGRATLHTP